MLSDDKGCTLCHSLPAAFPWSCLGHISVDTARRASEPGLNGWAVSLYYYTFASWVCSSASVPLETVLQSLHVKALSPHLWDALELSEQCWVLGRWWRCLNTGLMASLQSWHEPSQITANPRPCDCPAKWSSPASQHPQESPVASLGIQGGGQSWNSGRESGQWCHEDVGIRYISLTSSIVNTLSNSWYRDWKQVLTT